MPRFIETTDALRVLSEYYNYRTDAENYRLALAISKVPTADVVDRKKGKWNLVEYPDGYYHTECSECGCEYSENVYFDHDAKFCPSCGAKMDLD